MVEPINADLTQGTKFQCKMTVSPQVTKISRDCTLVWQGSFSWPN